MEQKLGRLPAMVITILAALAAYFLRLRQLETAFDEAGRVLTDLKPGLFTWVCVLVVVLFAVYSFLLRPRKQYSALTDRSPILLGLTIAVSLGMIVGCVAMALALEQLGDVLLAAGGVITAILWGVVGLDRYRGRQIPAAMFMVSALFYAIHLIYVFRDWSQDPQILDYCFDLLAMISIMCATFHLGGFCFDKGSRRLTVFFCFCGVIFGAAALAGGSLPEVGMTGGAMLWLLVNLHVLLRPARKRDAKA